MASKYVEAGLDRERLVVQSNGIDLPSVAHRLRGDGGKVRFLCAAYLGEHKGIPVLLKAVEALDRMPRLRGRWSMTLAGHGDLAGMVERAITEHGWGDRVAFVGRLPRPELLKLLQSSDVVVLPSVWPENEPVSLLEGMAAGAALIATRLGGNIELLRCGDSGLLVEPGSADDLALAMRRLIEEPGLLADFSRTNITLRPQIDERETVGRLIQLMSQDPPSRGGRKRPIILCGGDIDVAGSVLISTLGKVLPGVKPFLIPREWARPNDWEDAVAYWHFDARGDFWSVANALKRNLPIIVADGPLAASLAQNDCPVLRYGSAAELFDIIDELGGVGPPPPSMQSSLYRQGLQLRRAEAFRWSVASA
jgi:hypothetical protein